MSHAVAIDGKTLLAPESGGWRVVQGNRRSRIVYPTQADALRAVLSDAVQWEPIPKGKS